MPATPKSVKKITIIHIVRCHRRTHAPHCPYLPPTSLFPLHMQTPPNSLLCLARCRSTYAWSSSPLLHISCSYHPSSTPHHASIAEKPLQHAYPVLHSEHSPSAPTASPILHLSTPKVWSIWSIGFCLRTPFIMFGCFKISANMLKKRLSTQSSCTKRSSNFCSTQLIFQNKFISHLGEHLTFFRINRFGYFTYLPILDVEKKIQ